MRSTRLFAALAVLAALALVPAAEAAAPTMGMDHQTVRDFGADYVSASGCARTEVDVFAGDTLHDTGGSRPESGAPLDIQHVTGPFAGMHVQQWDCDGNLVFNGFGPPCCDPFPVDGVVVARDLTSAAVDTTLPVQDLISGSTTNYAVDLRLTAIPPLTRGHFGPSDTHCITRNGDQVENLIFNDVGRGYGASVAGSVSDGPDVYVPDDVLNAFIGQDVVTFVHVGFTDQPCG